jgi:hypothetical protein
MTEKKEVMTVDHQPSAVAAPAADMNPNQLIALAVQQGADLDKLEKLMDLQERFNAGEAKKAFNNAMSVFKKAAIVITRNADVKYSGTSYSHATLDHISKAIDEPLSDVGISYRWNTDQKDDGSVSVTCILTHDLGHSEETKLTAAPDKSGSKNPIQAIGSAVTYLQRYTLIAACGLTIGGMDDDAVSQVHPRITEDQVKELEKKLADSGADKKLFDKWLFTETKVKSYAELDETQFAAAIIMLDKKSKAKKGA